MVIQVPSILDSINSDELFSSFLHLSHMNENVMSNQLSLKTTLKKINQMTTPTQNPISFCELWKHFLVSYELFSVSMLLFLVV